MRHVNFSIKQVLTAVCAFSIIGYSAALCGPLFTQIDVFRSDTDGYHTYRIPAIIVSKEGTVLAFCEGRKKGRSDTGDIDLVLKRSFDNGRTWQPMKIIWDDGENVCGNPCPVVDRETGVIWLLLTHNLGHDSEKEIVAGTSTGSRTVWVMKSADDGETWSEPVEITDTTKQPGWTWYATGPRVGIQLTSGRLIIPCDHRVRISKADDGQDDYSKSPGVGSHVFFSDDHGATWELGGFVRPQTNECQVVECADGSLLLNMRNYSGNNRRAIATSRDGGITWSEVSYDDTLIEPVCQAGLLRYSKKKNRILFSNPAATERVKMTVRLSYDDCKTWPVKKLIYSGYSAYSCLTVLSDRKIGCLYERGSENAYELITLAVFNLEWLTDGKDSLEKKDKNR